MNLALKLMARDFGVSTLWVLLAAFARCKAAMVSLKLFMAKDLLLSGESIDFTG